MKCCPNCFADCFLIKHIQAISNQVGRCSFCEINETAIVEPSALIDYFEPLLDLYNKNNSGDTITKLVQSDWNVFSKKEPAIQEKLLKAILQDEKLFKANYNPILLRDSDNIKLWEEFKEELKHENRFFPRNAPNKSHLEPFGKYIGLKLNIDSQYFYRARVNISNDFYTIHDMGKPPSKKAANGRANPLGISYLYLASDIDTAISEIRGHKGENITVAKLKMNSSLELADLRDPKNTISPFELNGENELALLYQNMPFLSLLGNELSKPIIPREANLEYLPSQYLCELLKQIGFHGIIYKSSLTSGSNYVIFEDSKLEAVSIDHYKITNISIASNKISS